MESSKLMGAHRTVSRINTNTIAASVKESLFCISQLVFVIISPILIHFILLAWSHEIGVDQTK